MSELKVEVGKTYRKTGWISGEFIQVIFVGKRKMFVTDSTGKEFSAFIIDGWKPVEIPSHRLIEYNTPIVGGLSSTASVYENFYKLNPHIEPISGGYSSFTNGCSSTIGGGCCSTTMGEPDKSFTGLGDDPTNSIDDVLGMYGIKKC
jgi:hypothetical protein